MTPSVLSMYRVVTSCDQSIFNGFYLVMVIYHSCCFLYRGYVVKALSPYLFVTYPLYKTSHEFLSSAASQWECKEKWERSSQFKE